MPLELVDQKLYVRSRGDYRYMTRSGYLKGLPAQVVDYVARTGYQSVASIRACPQWDENEVEYAIKRLAHKGITQLVHINDGATCFSVLRLHPMLQKVTRGDVHPRETLPVGHMDAGKEVYLSIAAGYLIGHYRVKGLQLLADNPIDICMEVTMEDGMRFRLIVAPEQEKTFLQHFAGEAEILAEARRSYGIIYICSSYKRMVQLAGAVAEGLGRAFPKTYFLYQQMLFERQSQASVYRLEHNAEGTAQIQIINLERPL